MYTYIETRETRERDSFFSLSSSFNILSCNSFSRLDSFLSFARFEVSRTRARRKTACVVRFLFPRASHGIVVDYTVGERGIQNETARISFAIRKFRSLEKLPFTLTRHHQTRISHFESRPHFSKSSLQSLFRTSRRENNSPRGSGVNAFHYVNAPTGTKHIVKHWIRTGNDRRSTKDKMMPDSRERIRYRFHTKKWGKRVDDRTFGTMPRLFAQKRK